MSGAAFRLRGRAGPACGRRGNRRRAGAPNGREARRAFNPMVSVNFGGVRAAEKEVTIMGPKDGKFVPLGSRKPSPERA